MRAFSSSKYPFHFAENLILKFNSPQVSVSKIPRNSDTSNVQIRSNPGWPLKPLYAPKSPFLLVFRFTVNFAHIFLPRDPRVPRKMHLHAFLRMFAPSQIRSGDNQAIIQSTNRSINQSIDQSIHKSTKKLIDQSIHYSINQ